MAATRQLPNHLVTLRRVDNALLLVLSPPESAFASLKATEIFIKKLYRALNPVSQSHCMLSGSSPFVFVRHTNNCYRPLYEPDYDLHKTAILQFLTLAAKKYNMTAKELWELIPLATDKETKESKKIFESKFKTKIPALHPEKDLAIHEVDLPSKKTLVRLSPSLLRFRKMDNPDIGYVIIFKKEEKVAKTIYQLFMQNTGLPLVTQGNVLFFGNPDKLDQNQVILLEAGKFKQKAAISSELMQQNIITPNADEKKHTEETYQAMDKDLLSKTSAKRKIDTPLSTKPSAKKRAKEMKEEPPLPPMLATLLKVPGLGLVFWEETSKKAANKADNLARKLKFSKTNIKFRIRKDLQVVFIHDKLNSYDGSEEFFNKHKISIELFLKRCSEVFLSYSLEKLLTNIPSATKEQEQSIYDAFKRSFNLKKVFKPSAEQINFMNDIKHLEQEFTVGSLSAPLESKEVEDPTLDQIMNPSIDFDDEIEMKEDEARGPSPEDQARGPSRLSITPPAEQLLPHFVAVSPLHDDLKIFSKTNGGGHATLLYTPERSKRALEFSFVYSSPTKSPEM